MTIKVTEKVTERVTVKWGAPQLRHTLATRCIEAGMRPKTLQGILGHTNIGITMNLYVHNTEEEKEKKSRSLKRRFG